MEAEAGEAGPSQSSYIIPVSDVTIERSEDAVLDAVRYGVASSRGQRNNRIKQHCHQVYSSDVTTKWESDA